MDESEIAIRVARPDERSVLTELAVRSKSHWGYSEGFLDSARADLTIDTEAIEAEHVHVLVRSGRVIGFYGLLGEPPKGRLEWMFLEPEAIGRGHGRRMWNHAMAHAVASDYVELVIESDRFAEPFYLAMGATRIGSSRSPVDGEPLPLLKLDMDTAR